MYNGTTNSGPGPVVHFKGDSKDGDDTVPLIFVVHGHNNLITIIFSPGTRCQISSSDGRTVPSPCRQVKYSPLSFETVLILSRLKRFGHS